jgi:hypothetical protein
VLLELGVTDAVNLDGGGSSTLVVRDLVLNQPSDSTGERENGDGLLVFRRGPARVGSRELDTARSEPDGARCAQPLSGCGSVEGKENELARRPSFPNRPTLLPT